MHAKPIQSYALALLLMALGACATTPPPGLPPVVGLDASKCDAAPYLTDARALPYPDKKAKPLVVDLNAAARCLADGGGASTYAAFVLPRTTTPYIISVAVTPLPPAIFAPKLRLLDEQGRGVREIPGSGFLFRGTDLTAEFRSHEEELYLLVLSDPAIAGKKISRINTGTSSSTVSTGYVTFSVYSGIDKTNELTFSHNGKVTITVLPLTTK